MSKPLPIGTAAPGKQRHPSVTADRVAELCQRRMTSLDDPGICFACGSEADGVEPDARKYLCDCCGQYRIYGSEEAILMLA
jgi:hypothetical protein